MFVFADARCRECRQCAACGGAKRTSDSVSHAAPWRAYRGVTLSCRLLLSIDRPSLIHIFCIFFFFFCTGGQSEKISCLNLCSVGCVVRFKIDFIQKEINKNFNF